MRKSSRLRRAALVVGLMVVAAGVALSLAACGDDGASGSSTGSSGTIVGAGASFPYPLYSKWGEEYNAEQGIKLNYQSIGSGGGIAAIEARTVDFGASDAPLEQAELEEAGLLQFPLCVGGVVPVVNLPGTQDGQLRLTADVLAAIFMGEVTTWNDARVTELNKGMDLPGDKINVVHRSDGSGTTWIFTNYLTDAAGDVWTAGADKEIAWPTGVGGKGNEGVAASVQQLKGSIGYVEYAYAKQTGMPTVQLQNKDGAWVKPSIETFTEAAANADRENAPGFFMVLVNQPGKDTWPITGASFILVQKQQDDAGRAQTMLQFFDWAFRNGAATAESLDYVAIPESVYTLIEQEWQAITAAGEPVWPK